MKKFVSLLLVLFLLMPITCFAENDIQLIAGLKFGMDINQAAAISKYEIVDTPDAWRESYLRDILGLSNEKYIVGKGTIGGYQCAAVGTFDALDRLIQVIYFLDTDYFDFKDDKTAQTKNTYVNQYHKVETALTTQYGVGLGVGDAISLSVGIPSVNSTPQYQFHQDFTHQVFNLEYSQRTTTQTDQSTVVIEHAVQERLVNAMSTFCDYGHVLIYTYYDFPISKEEQTYSIGF